MRPERKFTFTDLRSNPYDSLTEPGKKFPLDRFVTLPVAEPRTGPR